MKVVIIGGVAAGAAAAARLRRLDEKAEIVILEKGEYVSFANCGLPYHLGGAIAKRGDLLVSTPRNFQDNFAIEVRTGHEATAIDRAAKEVGVTELVSGNSYREPYDKLILCQGATPVEPQVEGAGHPCIHTLRTLPQMDAVKALVDEGKAKTAVVIGANYVGLETAEALIERGLVVDLVELQPQVMPALDPEMAIDLEQHLAAKGVRLHLGCSASSFADTHGRVEMTLSDGKVIDTDLVVLAIGVRPETTLARSAGLELGATGGVKVDGHLLTSDPDIYAAGDMVEVTHAITGAAALLPLAGPASRQGRIVADHICGRDSAYGSTQGTAIVKVFEMAGASTGASERLLQASGIPYKKLHLYPFGHASYYPRTAHMHTKVLFSPEDGRLLGAQIVGFDGVDKRIDLLAVAVRTGMTVYDLEELELAYSPPYGSAKDPINMVGFVGANMLDGTVDFWYAETFPELTDSGTILDVRTAFEHKTERIPGSLNIPLHQLRQRLAELEDRRDQPIFVYCLTGIRSYLAYRILVQNGFTRVLNLAGGIKTFKCVHPRMSLAPEGELAK